jgi:hypothetical protein
MYVVSDVYFYSEMHGEELQLVGSVGYVGAARLRRTSRLISLLREGFVYVLAISVTLALLSSAS